MIINIIVLFTMVFLHIKDDFNQHIMADLKCKAWWEKNEPADMYKKDYKIVLFLHAFSWCFAIHIPIIVWILYDKVKLPVVIFIFTFIANLYIHYMIDDMKANKRWINLTADQVMHLVQILITWLLYTCLSFVK